MRSIKQLVKHIAISLVCITPYANCMGQICQNPDSTIVGVLTLCCYQNGSLPYSIEDSLLIDGTQHPLNVKNDIYSRSITFLYALYLNIDSTELLIAIQAPGMNRGNVGELMVVSIDKDDFERLPLTQCTYTNLPHFQTEQGVRIGMTYDELIALKGNQFHKNEDGFISYESLSPVLKNDSEAIEYGEKYGVGDLSLTVHFEEEVVDWFRLEWGL